MTKLIPVGMNDQTGLLTTAQAGDSFIVVQSSLSFTATVAGGSGIAVIYLTDSGLITGNPLFDSVSFINLQFSSNDPNFGVSYVLAGTALTLTCMKQAFSGTTILGINVLGTVALGVAANGTVLNVQVTGVLTA